MDEDNTASEAGMQRSLRARVSRAQLLTAAGAGMALAALPDVVGAAGAPGQMEFPFYPHVQGRYTAEDMREILNAVVTTHYLGATGGTTSLANAAALGLIGWQLSMQQAAVAREQYHIDFLTSLGASPLATAFTLPPGASSKRAVAFGAAEGALTVQVAAHMTAAREFAELGQPTLAKWMYQMGTQEAEQRAIYRALLAIDGVPTAIPPNNKAFATDLFLYARDVLSIYKALGLIGGSAPAVSYPGRDAVLAAAGPMASAVIQKRPNDAASTIALTGPASLTGERT